MLAQWYPPIIGGEELHVANLSRALVARGHAVTVATLQQEGLEERENDHGVEVVRLTGALQRVESLFADAARRSAAPIVDPLLTIALDRVVRTFRPDVMHAHNWLVHAALPIRAVRRIPLVQTLHDFSLVCAQKVLLRDGRPCSGPGPIKCLACTAHHYGPVKGPITTVSNWADGVAQRRLVDRFIAVSSAVVVGARLDGLPHEVIPNFVPDEASPRGNASPDADFDAGPDADSDADATIAAHVARLPAKPYFLFVGAIGRLKGVHVLLDAYRSGASLPPLVLIGYPTREADDLLRDLPANVHFLGQWPHAAVQAAWAGAIAGVVPSICQEACPTVVIEAMRAGRPVIASRLGGSLDLVDDGATGVLVDPDDAAALRAELAALAAEPDRARTLGARARASSAAYTASTVVPRIEGVYESVAGARRNPA